MKRQFMLALFVLTLFVGSSTAVIAGPEQQPVEAETRALRWLAQRPAGDSQKEPYKNSVIAKAITADGWLRTAEVQAVQIRSIRISGGVVKIRGNVIRSEGGSVEIILQSRPK